MNYKSTHEILESIKGRKGSDYWQKITGIPEFDPIKHSDGCSGGMSDTYAKLSKDIHKRFGETLPWRECCVVHDRAYYYSGSREEKSCRRSLEAVRGPKNQQRHLGEIAWIGDAACRFHRRLALFRDILPMGVR